MGLETATYISGLVAANPVAGDLKSEGDDHIRLIKSTLLATFPNINGAVGAADEDLAAMGDGFASITAGASVTLAADGFLRRGVDGLVVGAFRANYSGAAGATVVTLPAGYRPTADFYLMGVAYDASAVLYKTIRALIVTAGTMSTVNLVEIGTASAFTPAASDILTFNFCFPTR